MKRVSSLCPLCFALCCWQAEAQIYDTNNDVVQTFAGSGFYGYQRSEQTATFSRVLRKFLLRWLLNAVVDRKAKFIQGFGLHAVEVLA
jgi:hypothetical protein